MPQFVLCYFAGDTPTTKEEGQKHYAQYQKWLSDLGTAVISPANPFKNTHTLNPNGSITAKSNSTMSGYTILEADSMEKAIEMARSCPFLNINGTLEISERIKM